LYEKALRVLMLRVAFVAFAYKIIRSVEFVIRRHWVLGFSIRCSHYKCWYSLRANCKFARTKDFRVIQSNTMKTYLYFQVLRLLVIW